MAETRETVVLAYSGGLDTSCILVWLQEQGYKVVAFMADLGQEEDFEEAKKKATKLGATEVVLQDLRRELVEDFVWPAVRAGIVYEGRYLLGTALARPCITRALVALAKRVKADFVSHGATGKGNDQIRFELGCYTLCPGVEIIAPWKDPAFYKRFPGRPELFQYAKEHNIPLPVTPKSPWSMDANLIHISYESGVLEDPSAVPPAGIFQLTADPEKAPDTPQRLTVTFSHGLPESVTVDGEETITDTLGLFLACNRVGAAHGVGRVDLVENRFLGLKSRGVYETPGLTLLQVAHQDLEALCLDREVRKIKTDLSVRMAEQVYNGMWFSPEFEYTRQCVEASQEMVNGSVYLKVYKGNAVFSISAGLLPKSDLGSSAEWCSSGGASRGQRCLHVCVLVHGWWNATLYIIRHPLRVYFAMAHTLL